MTETCCHWVVLVFRISCINILQINPDIREAHMLKGWFDNGGNVAETVNLSGKGSQAGGGKHVEHVLTRVHK